MTRVAEVIRGWMGGCLNRSHRKTRGFAGPGLNDTGLTPPETPSAPVPAGTVTEEHRPEYQTSLLLILLFLFGLFYAYRYNLLIPFSLLSAILVYFDAENIHAGKKFKKESLLGEVSSWRPIVWAIAVCIGSFVLLAIYLVTRREIYNANN